MSLFQKTEIEKTDNEIDQMVYELYGLSEIYCLGGWILRIRILQKLNILTPVKSFYPCFMNLSEKVMSCLRNLKRNSLMINKGNIYSDIKGIISQARQKAHGSVNFIMVEAYWNIGRRIVLEEQSGKKRAAYGEGLIKKLSKELSQDFGKGFSVANLENFRKFYLTFQGEQIPYAVRRELSWTHFRLIIRVGNPKARDYYIKESAEQFWSTRQLERIEAKYEDETIWLTQKLMGELFEVGTNTINYHLKEIFKSSEIEESLVIRKFRITANDGKNYNTNFYNLDAIISVGYRVNSIRATQFRQWATVGNKSS